MKDAILLVGYGSIGKRHARNIIGLGLQPYVLTTYPNNQRMSFISDFSELKGKDIRYAVLATPTAKHLEDFKKCVYSLKSLKKVLIEKPLESSYLRGKEILRIAAERKIKINVAYNLRFMKSFDIIRNFIRRQKGKIRIVNVVAGHDLREWRPDKDIKDSYSARRELGGGVDLDLSHEIDYVLWLFGSHFRAKQLYRGKISSLKIDSPDYFKLLLDYKNFIADISLDYIRKPRERYLRINCDNGENLDYDFVKGRLKVNGKTVLSNDRIDYSYKRMLSVFLGTGNKAKLCNAQEALKILEILEV